MLQVLGAGFFFEGFDTGVVAPRPAEHFGENGAAVFCVVAFFADDHFVVVTRETEGGGQLEVAEGPAAPAVIEVSFSGLQVNADVSLFFEAYHGGVGVAPANVGETADMGDDFVEGVRAFPGDSEGADAAGADAADAATFGVVDQVVGLADFGENFVYDKTGVGVGEGVVFHGAVATGFFAFFFRGVFTGVDEDADGDGHFAFVDEVIEYGGGAEVAGEADVAAAVLEDHDASGGIGIVLSGYIKPVVAGGAFVDFTGGELVLGDGALGDAVLDEGVGAVCIFEDIFGVGVNGHKNDKKSGDNSHGDSLWVKLHEQLFKQRKRGVTS